MRPVAAFLLVLFSILASAAAADSLAPRTGWEVRPTSHSYGDLVNRIRDAVKAKGMLVVTQASASAGAKGQGIVIPGNRIIGVYRNDYARRMLAASIAAGIEAPVRYYVTENTDGTGTLSWKTPSLVFAPYMEEAGAALEELATELDTLFAGMAEDAIGQ